jgi:beta-mannosidase
MARVQPDCHRIDRLADGWEAASAPPTRDIDPDRLDELEWVPAQAPGTAAGALRSAGLWRQGDDRDFDGEDWWFRTTFPGFPADEADETILRLDGIATLCEVFLNDERVLESDSMFAQHAVDVGARLLDTNRLALRCRALAPELRGSRPPRARWRTKLVTEGNLRFFRTTLYGRAPSFMPGPPPVGPWRPIWLERRRRLAVDTLSLRARLDGPTGRLTVQAELRALGTTVPASADVELTGPSGAFAAPLELRATATGFAASGELLIPDVAAWWPHTHGCPTLHEVVLSVELRGETVRIAAGRVGFRRVSAGAAPGHDIESEGLDLHVNGVSTFVRGAVWMPQDPIGFAPSIDDLRACLERVRDAGMNMLRVPGNSCYEDELFYDLCDELGILVWQDFMFANLDYPIRDERFRTSVTEEVRAVLTRLAGRPALTVLCGNSEVEQQVSMLGLDPALGRGELFGELLPSLVEEAGADAVYVPSTPCGGDLPFRPNRGIANYYGVGGFFRPLSDARLADVRFAAECLPFANVPDDDVLDELFPDGLPSVDDARWKAGVQRDAGVSWDFDDVRDWYLGELLGVDALALRRSDPDRYLDLSRAVTGEVMSEVLGEWRRGASRCGGGLILWLRDRVPGAGFGVLDHRGRPKAAYHHLRRILAPLAVWTTDEGLGGIDVHMANDGPDAFSGVLRVSLYRDLELLVGEAVDEILLAPHSTVSRGVEEILGRFVDVSWAYRFGPPGQDVVVASLERDPGSRAEPVSRSVRFPVGRPLTVEPAHRLRLEAAAVSGSAGGQSVRLASKRLVYGVRVQAPGFEPSDDCFSLEPGGERLIRLHPHTRDSVFSGAEVVALNLSGKLHVGASESEDER